MQGYSTVGSHVVVDIWGVDFDRLNDLEFLMGTFREAIIKSGATILGELEHKFDPQGCSGLFLLSESHSGFHSYPEKGYVSCCLYTCGNTIKPEKAFRSIYKQLDPEKIYDIRITRGIGEFGITYDVT